MSQFCSLDEAFGPVQPGNGKKMKKDGSRKEGDAAAVPAGIESFVPSQLPPVPDPDRPAARPGPAPPAMHGASSAGGARLEADGTHDFFPLPGETAAPEEWAKAFMLEPSQTAATVQPTRFRGPSAIRESVTPVPVNGLPTLWRDASAAVAPVSSDISARLDTLTKQLESLTTPTPVQGTAELFLFVAIGLLILLAIDSIMRFATAMVTRTGSGGGQRGGAFIRRTGRWRL